MNAHSDITKGSLVYGGVAIRDRGEMLSLTDMWKAAGSPENREPFNWSRFEGKGFIEAVSVAHNLSEDQVMTTKRGKGGATFAHWQIGLAYAKYLSPEFHMWCNEVVRARMEGGVRAGVPGDTLDQIERSFGIMRMLAHKVTEIEKAIPGLVASLVEPLVAARFAEQHLLLRRGQTAKQIWDAAGFPPRIKGSTLWFGNRLAKLGCLVEGGLRADRGDGSIRLFDPDKAKISLDLGFAKTVEAYVAQRKGQRVLNLVGGGA